MVHKYYTFMTDPEHSDWETVVKAKNLKEAYKKLFKKEGLKKEDVVIDEIAILDGKITQKERELVRKVK
jgi:hypothetical protein